MDLKRILLEGSLAAQSDVTRSPREPACNVRADPSSIDLRMGERGAARFAVTDVPGRVAG